MKELEELRHLRSAKQASNYYAAAAIGCVIVMFSLLVLWLIIGYTFLQLGMHWAGALTFIAPLIGIPALLYFDHWREYYSGTIN
jgi:hypothetical protein